MYAQKAAGKKPQSSKTGHKNGNKRKNEAMKNRKGFFFAKFLFFTVIVIMLFGLGVNLHKINVAKAELDSLKQEHNTARINNEALQQQLDAPVDADYIANVVRSMGYRKSDEILFYIDSDE